MNSQIIIYQTEDGNTKLDVRLENETVWLTQKLMAELFQTTIANINIHLKNIFKEGKIIENSVIKDYLITASDGKKHNTKRLNKANNADNDFEKVIKSLPPKKKKK